MVFIVQYNILTTEKILTQIYWTNPNDSLYLKKKNNKKMNNGYNYKVTKLEVK